MATSESEIDDTSQAVRRRFLQAVATAELPIRARRLSVPGLDRRSIQKRLERLRRYAGGAASLDEALQAFARAELDRMAPALTRGLSFIESLARPQARALATSAVLNAMVLDDWIELAHSPGDRGWSASEIHVRRLADETLRARGVAQGWWAEREAYLERALGGTSSDPGSALDWPTNDLKMDLAGLVTGSQDSPACLLDVAPVEWRTCLSLNARLDEAALTRKGTVREAWARPAALVERTGLPGMLVAHVVVRTSDGRFLVCLRPNTGVRDETGTWSLSLEERWSAEQDPTPHELVRRAVFEELGVRLESDEVRVLSWGLEASVLYPGFVALADVDLASWQVERQQPHAADASEIRYVASLPADVTSLAFLLEGEFAPRERPELKRPWHRTARARLFVALAYLLSHDGGEGRADLLRRLGSHLSPLRSTQRFETSSR